MAAKGLRVLMKLAALCNLGSLLMLLLLWRNPFGSDSLVSYAVILGYAMALIVNPLSNLLTLLYLRFSRQKRAAIPKGLAIFNFSFLLLQILYLVFLNRDP